MLRNYAYLVANASKGPKIREEQARNFALQGAEGPLLAGHDRSPEIIKFLNEKIISELVGWAHNSSLKLLSATFNHFMAMSEFARHVIEIEPLIMPEINAIHPTSKSGKVGCIMSLEAS